MKKSTRYLIMVLRIVIGLGLITYLGVSGVIDGSTLFGLIKAWPIALLALFLLLSDMGITSWRLCLLLKPHGLHLTWLSSLRLTLIGTFFNVCLPGATGGDMVRIYYAAGSNPGRRTEVATILLLDRAVGMFGLVVLPLLLALLFPGLLVALPGLPILLASGAAVALVMVVVMLICTAQRVRHSRVIAWLSDKLPMGRQVMRVLDTVHGYRHSKRSLLVAVGLSLVVQSLMIVVVLLITQIINPAGAAWPMIMLVPLGFLANALPLTPGGLGVGEAAFGKLFALAGLTGGAEALLGWRILMMMIGLIGLVFYLRGGKHFVLTRSQTPPAAGIDAPSVPSQEEGFAYNARRASASGSAT